MQVFGKTVVRVMTTGQLSLTEMLLRQNSSGCRNICEVSQKITVSQTRQWGTTITPVVGVPVDPAEASRRRQLIAKLTEERLRNPTRFREEARARGVGVRGGGQVHVRQPPRRPSNEPYRRAQHFTLADIDRARISDEITNMPNYADQYRLDRQGQSAHDYSTLVSRMYDPELIAREALDDTNQYRASRGLAPLRWHGDVARIAAEHAGQMASGTAPFSHDGFNQRVNRYPMPHRGAAENLALTSGDSRVAKVAVDGWIKSPGHEKNLRGPFNTCGIGVARSATGTFLPHGSSLLTPIEEVRCRYLYMHKEGSIHVFCMLLKKTKN